MEIIKIIKTCPSNPAEWSVYFNNGLELYVRYRYSTLYIGYGKTEQEAIENSVCYKRLNLKHNLDGELETIEMIEQIKSYIDNIEYLKLFKKTRKKKKREAK